jgi:hypothetical protein
LPWTGTASKLIKVGVGVGKHPVTSPITVTGRLMHTNEVCLLEGLYQVFQLAREVDKSRLSSKCAFKACNAGFDE